jgi:phage terminase large subunit GpA-like protein
LIAHTSKGVTYSVEHGSIGTFKRTRKKSVSERENESNRDKYTYQFGQTFSVWPYLMELIQKNWIGQSGNAYDVDITIIDTGHFTKLSYDFIKSCTNNMVIGIKGYGQDEYRKLTKDTPIVKRSAEMQGYLYILQVNQLKEILASNMKLKMGMDGFQPTGFMNFPMSEKGKYAMKSYFSHFESEHRVPEMKNDVEIGFAWKKKNSSIENHFFDVMVYNMAAPYVYIDILRRSSSKYSKLTWEDFVQLME